ncbi:HAD family phosphatase [bacterium]|nr:HAD family phosphatase [bacterium]
MKYKGIIFDFNGTLLFDSEKHLEAWREYSRQLRGVAFTDEEMRDYMFGRTNEDIIAYAIGKKPEPELVEKLGLEKEAVYRDMCRNDRENFKLAPYAEEFLNYLKENDIPRTIATMSGWENVEFYIEEFKLERWFDLDKIVYANGKIPGKPAPDIYQIAAKNLGLKPEECIVVEDAVSGIDSAKNAGIGKIIAIASMEPVELYEKMPHVAEVITDFSQISKSQFEVLNNVI